MSFAMTLFGWVLVFCGVIAALAIIGICLGFIIIYIATSWATVIGKDQVIIRRIIGWRTSAWYIRDDFREMKEFGIWTARKEEFVLKRYVRKRIEFSEPLWEIYQSNAQSGHETVISYFPDRTLEVRENLNGRRWIGFRVTRSELKNSRFEKIIERAESLQKETEKRFKSLLAEKYEP